MPKHTPKSTRTILSPADWIARLRDGRTHLELGRAFGGPVAPSWSTQPRTPESKFEVHYLFMAERAEMDAVLHERTIKVPPRALVWFPPGAYYELHMANTRPCKLLRLRFRTEARGRPVVPWKDAAIFRDALSFPNYFNSLYAEMRLPQTFQDERARALIVLMTTDLLRLHEEAGATERRLGRAQILTLIQCVRDQPARRWTPRELAGRLDLSPAYFARVFGATMGASPRRWLLEERIRLAAEYLQDGALNVNQVAARLGYAGPHLFSRQFKQVMGVNPSDYRRGATLF